MFFKVAMSFPPDDKPVITVPVSLRLPHTLLARIDADVDSWNRAHPKSPENRTDRMIYLLQYAFQAGELNCFIDLMREQYLKILMQTPAQVALGASSYIQVEALNEKVDLVCEKLDEISRLYPAMVSK
jgi:hypothetical protein